MAAAKTKQKNYSILVEGGIGGEGGRKVTGGLEIAGMWSNTENHLHQGGVNGDSRG